MYHATPQRRYVLLLKTFINHCIFFVRCAVASLREVLNVSRYAATLPRDVFIIFHQSLYFFRSLRRSVVA